jgi:transposase
MHSTSVAVSREPRRAKTDRLDTEMLIRVFLGWLRGEPRHCKMVAIPTLEEEDANNRDKNFTVAKVAKRIEQVEASIARYLAVLDRADREDGDMAEANRRRPSAERREAAG